MDFLEYLSVQHKIMLNPQQEQAVLTIDGATLLLAVPGSGKTTVIITRLGNMIFNHQIPPELILNISFSRASAHDLKSRFVKLFGPDPDGRVEIRTIHSFCLKVLKECYSAENKVVPKLIEDHFSRIKKLYVEQTKKYIGDEIIKEIIQKISYSTNMLLPLEKVKEIEVAGCDFYGIYNEYM
jgi:DNA helicase-2/ATP-dependent DNA helicase PcrA